MCGISGLVGPGAGDCAADLARMVAAQRHRGPDDEGMAVYPNAALGHNRLSILDLSPAGHQPMTSPDGRYTLVFNGEIYNYIELRDAHFAGETLAADNDSAVLLAAFAKWGHEVVHHLRGMFAFAIWDAAQGELFLARDRFGIKPLYHARHQGRFLFGSEGKAILAAGYPVAANRAVVGRYLTTALLDDGEDTFFAGIKRLLAGHRMVVGGDGTVRSCDRWYRLEDGINPALSDLDAPSAVERFRAKLDETVRIHLRSDVPVGMTISGGVDSSALLALACPPGVASGDFRAYSFDFADARYSERSRVERIVEGRGISTTFCPLDIETCLERMDRVTWHQEAPFGGVPTVAMFGVYQTAKADGTTVLLNGNGADDYLAGSRREVTIYMASLIQDGHIELFEREVPGFLKMWGGTRDGLDAAVRQALAGEARAMGADGTVPTRVSAVRPEYRLIDGGDSAPPFHAGLFREALHYRLFSGKMPRSLRFDDHNSMAASCEVRVPFLDHELAELAFSLPAALLVQDGVGKFVLREALRGTIPESIRTAPKHNVQSPQREWFKSGLLRERLDRVLADPVAPLADVLDLDEARKVYTAYLNGDDSNSNFLWQWLNLDQWGRTFLGSHNPSRSASPT